MFKSSERKGAPSKTQPYASSAKLSVASVTCRICYDNEKGEDLVAPCYCKGTIAFVHRTCLDAWLAESGSTNCELCHHMYRTDKAPRRNPFQSLWDWLKNGPRSPEHGVRVHIIACTVITPLAIILVTYIVCMYYSQKSASTSSGDSERDSSVSLLTVLAIILIGYYLWVYSVTRLHAKWQRSCIIRYIPRNRPEDQVLLVPRLGGNLNTQENVPARTIPEIFACQLNSSCIDNTTQEDSSDSTNGMNSDNRMDQNDSNTINNICNNNYCNPILPESSHNPTSSDNVKIDILDPVKKEKCINLAVVTIRQRETDVVLDIGHPSTSNDK